MDEWKIIKREPKRNKTIKREAKPNKKINVFEFDSFIMGKTYRE